MTFCHCVRVHYESRVGGILQDPPRTAPAILLQFTASQLESGKQGKKQQKSKVVHTVAATWWTITMLVFWIAIMCHIKDSITKQGIYQSIQGLSGVDFLMAGLHFHSPGSTALPRLFNSSKAPIQQRAGITRQQEGAQHSDCVFALCLLRLCGKSFQRGMSRFLHFPAWPNVLFFFLFL